MNVSGLPEEIRPSPFIEVQNNELLKKWVSEKLFLGEAHHYSISLGKDTYLIGLTGFNVDSRINISNRLEDGNLNLGLEVPINVGNNAFSGSINIQANDEKVANFEGIVKVKSKHFIS